MPPNGNNIIALISDSKLLFSSIESSPVGSIPLGMTSESNLTSQVIIIYKAEKEMAYRRDSMMTSPHSIVQDFIRLIENPSIEYYNIGPGEDFLCQLGCPSISWDIRTK